MLVDEKREKTRSAKLDSQRVKDNNFELTHEKGTIITRSEKTNTRRSIALQLWTPSKGVIEPYNADISNGEPPQVLFSLFEAGLSLFSKLETYVKPFRAIALPVTKALSNIMYGEGFNGKEFKPGDYLGNAWRLALGFTPNQDFPIPMRPFKSYQERLDFYDDWAEHYYRSLQRGDVSDDPLTIQLGDDAATTPTYDNSTNAIQIQFNPTSSSSILPAVTITGNKGTILATEDQVVSNNYNLSLNLMGVTNV